MYRHTKKSESPSDALPSHFSSHTGNRHSSHDAFGTPFMLFLGDFVVHTGLQTWCLCPPGVPKHKECALKKIRNRLELFSQEPLLLAMISMLTNQQYIVNELLKKKNRKTMLFTD